MAVYVDPLSRSPTSIRCFKDGSCHMAADGEAELLAFARRIGLRREWLQKAGTRRAHFDLTPRRRAAAVALAAVTVTARQFVTRMLLAEDDDRIATELDRQAEPYGGDWLTMLHETSRPCVSIEDAVR